MVVSLKPILLGNMPEKGSEHLYEKVAFMGQVPVAVLGNVKIGDYILPSGTHTGRGIAKSPDRMKPSDYKNIVGVAWSASKDNTLNIINVAVGLNTHDLSVVVEKQAAELDELKKSVKETNLLLSQLVPGFKEASASLTQNGSLATAAAVPSTSNSISQSPSQSTLNATSSNQADVPTRTAEPLDKGKVIYWEISDQYISEGFDGAMKIYRETGGKVEDNPYLNRLKTDPAFRAASIISIKNKIKDSFHSHQEINHKFENGSHSHD